MKRLKVLHITNWYPNAEEPFEALFIRKHVRALGTFADNDVLHLRVRRSNRFRWIASDEGGEQLAYDLELPIKRWRLIEWATSFLLFRVLRSKFDLSTYDLVNFHIAYPLCVPIKKLQKELPCPFLITEHWTAYHFNFNLPWNTDKLDRIKRIFRQGVPLITVSEALKRDIEEFSGAKQENAHVVPNVVDTERFFYDPEKKRNDPEAPVFFMLNYWRRIKSPFVLFDSFRELLKEKPKAILRVGGYGPLWKEMEGYVEEAGLSDSIQLLGRLGKEEVAREMQSADAFVHAASYETFSVVCAEALCCGTPVAVTRIPAVAEFVDEGNGILVDKEEDWPEVFHKLSSYKRDLDPLRISERALTNFTPKAVGERYSEVLGWFVDNG